MELNPNHPVTRAVRAEWHKLAALVLYKLNHTHVVITSDDIDRIENADLNIITVEEKRDGIHLRLVSRRQAEALLAKSGGLATDS